MHVLRPLVVASMLMFALGLNGQATGRTPVLVELFTSEGCSSCPPADVLLAKLGREQPVAKAEIIILEEHVDYWDSLGWRDRFSSHAFTERQNLYGRHFNLPDVYTPQMVVAGRKEFNGSDADAASRAIVQAARRPGVAVTIAEVRLDGRHVSARADVAGGGSGDLVAALVAPMETTNVKTGENGGRTLRHAGVVLAMKRIGGLGGRSAVDFEVPAGEGAVSLVVFAQEVGGGAILGAASAVVPAGGVGAVASLKR